MHYCDAVFNRRLCQYWIHLQLVNTSVIENSDRRVQYYHYCACCQVTNYYPLCLADNSGNFLKPSNKYIVNEGEKERVFR